MPGPPPPPPMAPAAPPPPTFSLPKGSDDRGALLKSIRQGAKLKKTVTVDKSAPVITGKVSNTANVNSNRSGGTNTSNNSVQSTPNGLALGGLFAGGMPKLKPTGRLGSSTLTSPPTNNNNNNTESSSPRAPPGRNFNSVQDKLKKQLHSETRTRGPPPPAPTRNISMDESRSLKPLALAESSSNGLHYSQSSLQPNLSTLHLQNRKSKSNANLVTLDSTDGVNSSAYQLSKPVINHGKPNLAPKPPTTNGKPAPPLKLSIKPNKPISRAQSMRSPRSPSPQDSSAVDASIKFGTVRNISSLLGPTLSAGGGQTPSKPRPALTTRPTVPPPLAPPPSAPNKTNVVKPPNHAPPPPPGLPQPPSTPPPPPPHKTQTLTQPVRPPPAVPTNNNNNNNNANPPPPPPRYSSMRDANQTRKVAVDLEEKYKQEFATIDRFPRPPAYRNVLKLYSNKQVTNKQQAPLPPQLQTPNRVWNSTSTC